VVESMTVELLPIAPNKGRYLQSFARPLLVGLLIATCWVVAWVSVDLQSMSAFMTVLCSCILIFTIPLVIVWVLMLAIKKTRIYAIQWVIIALCLIVPIGAAIPIGSVLADVLLKQRLQRIIASTTPLINAIKKYASENHRAPMNLQVLVPKYIGTVPPDSNLSSGSSYGDKHTVYRYRLLEEKSEAPWELKVNVGYPSDVSSLLYLPTENYPPDYSFRSTTDPPQRIGAWEFHP
jgi:hypothetical protein